MQQLYIRWWSGMALMGYASGAVCTHEPIRANGLEQFRSCGFYWLGLGREGPGGIREPGRFTRPALLSASVVGPLSKCVVSAVGWAYGNPQSMQPVISTGPCVAPSARWEPSIDKAMGGAYRETCRPCHALFAWPGLCTVRMWLGGVMFCTRLY
jgi:hypothetical protein